MIFMDSPPEHRSAWKTVAAGGRKFLTLIVIGAGSLGLFLFARQLARQDQVSEAKNHPGGGIIVRSEVLQLWLPRTLIELAKCQTEPSRIRTHGELQRILEGRDQRDAWYALTTRAHLVNGDFVDLTIIRWPYRDSRYFPELLDVLAVAGGHPPSDPNAGFSNVSISILPDDSLTREPRAVMRDALGMDLKKPARLLSIGSVWNGVRALRMTRCDVAPIYTYLLG
jgi:hypothetical protein